MEYVLEMIMSPFWRELKWKMWWDGCLSSDRHDGGEFTGTRRSAAEPAKDEESRTRKIILVQITL